MIKLIKSTFYKEKETKARLIDFIKKAKCLSFGVECEKFEENFAKYQGRKYAVFFNSGSSANLAIIQSLLNLDIIKKDEEIGFSSITWATNVMPLIQLGLNPIPIDVEIDNLNVSSKEFLRCLEKHSLKAFFITNALGFCADINKIKEICDEKNIVLIEDNCESLGTVYKGKKLGNFGLASTFSFYVGHHLSAIEGGMVCTDDREIAEMLRMVRAHGWDRNLEKDKKQELREKFGIDSDFLSRYTFYDLAYNLRPTEIQGFLGNIQLQFIDEINKKRNQNFLKLAEKIYKRRDLYLPIRYQHIDFVSNFAFPLVCRNLKIKNELIKKCQGRIEVRPIIGGNITSQPFFKKYDIEKKINQKDDLKNASVIDSQGLYLGNNPELDENELKEIIDICS